MGRISDHKFHLKLLRGGGWPTIKEKKDTLGNREGVDMNCQAKLGGG